ncbi:hypothetical protein ACHAW6_000166 [Cyclotella cf. meneghiniana]
MLQVKQNKYQQTIDGKDHLFLHCRRQLKLIMLGCLRTKTCVPFIQKGRQSSQKTSNLLAASMGRRLEVGNWGDEWGFKGGRSYYSFL